MMADMTKDRRVTVLIQGPNHPAFSDGSRLFAALPSPVHEELGYGLSRPTGYKVMRIFPQSLPRPSPLSCLLIPVAPTRCPPTGRRRLTRHGRSSTTCGRPAHSTTKPHLLTNQTPYKDEVLKWLRPPLQLEAERRSAGAAARATHGEHDALLLLFIEVGAFQHVGGLL